MGNWRATEVSVLINSLFGTAQWRCPRQTLQDEKAQKGVVRGHLKPWPAIDALWLTDIKTSSDCSEFLSQWQQCKITERKTDFLVMLQNTFVAFFTPPFWQSCQFMLGVSINGPSRLSRLPVILLLFFGKMGAVSQTGCYSQYCVLNGAFCLTISGVCWKARGRGGPMWRGQAPGSRPSPLSHGSSFVSTLSPDLYLFSSCFQPCFFLLTCSCALSFISSSIGGWIINKQWLWWLWRW